MRYFEVASKLIAQEPNKELPGYGLGQRHIQILLQFSLATIYVAMNMTLPIAIVAMTTNTTTVEKIDSPIYQDQSLILVSVQCGYAITQLFGGCISKTYGYQFVMSFSMFLCVIFCLLLPIMTDKFGSDGLMICLMLQGASQGLALPVIPDFLNRWVPKSERNSIGTFMYAANALGAALSTKITAYLSASFLGWSFAYYLIGGLGLVWIYFMLHFGKNTPENCDKISAEEREFLKYDKFLRDKVPWRKILTSPALLAIWAAHAGTFWTLWLMTAEIPSYLSKVLKYNIQKDGDIISNAYFMSWLFSFIMGGVTNYLIKSKIVTVGVTRKVSQSIASGLSAACLIILGFVSEPSWVLFYLTSIFVALTASFWGFMLNYNDITNNRGIASEIGGFIATLTSLLPAILKQFIVTDQSDRGQWAIMFWITAVIAILSNIAFFFYSAGNIQEWDLDLSISGTLVEKSVKSVKEKCETTYLMEERVKKMENSNDPQTSAVVENEETDEETKTEEENVNEQREDTESNAD